jgi:hypothetical protein
MVTSLWKAIIQCEDFLVRILSFDVFGCIRSGPRNSLVHKIRLSDVAKLHFYGRIDFTFLIYQAFSSSENVFPSGIKAENHGNPSSFHPD